MDKKHYKLVEPNTNINTRKRLIGITVHRINTINNISNLFYRRNGLYTAVIVLKCKTYKFTNNLVLFRTLIYKHVLKYNKKNRYTHKSLIRFPNFYKIGVLYRIKWFIKYNFHNDALYYNEVFYLP